MLRSQFEIQSRKQNGGELLNVSIIAYFSSNVDIRAISWVLCHSLPVFALMKSLNSLLATWLTLVKSPPCCFKYGHVSIYLHGTPPSRYFHFYIHLFWHKHTYDGISMLKHVYIEHICRLFEIFGAFKIFWGQLTQINKLPYTNYDQ